MSISVRGEKRAAGVILRAGRKAQDQEQSLEQAGRVGGLVAPGDWQSQTGNLSSSLASAGAEASGDRLVLTDDTPYARFVFYGTSRQAPRPPTVRRQALAAQAAREVARDLVPAVSLEDLTFEQAWGPEPYDDPLEVFGPLIGAHEVEAAIVEILQTWTGTYVNEVCRRAGLAPGTLPPIRSWRVSSDILALPEDQMPRVIVRSLAAQVLRRGGGSSSHQQTWRWTLEAGVQTVTRSVKSANAASPQPRLVALMYATALRGALIQKRDAGKRLGMIDVEGERYTELDPSADRTTHLASVLLQVEVPRAAEWGRGPATPLNEPDDPDVPPGPEEPTWAAAESVEPHIQKPPAEAPLEDDAPADQLPDPER